MEGKQPLTSIITSHMIRLSDFLAQQGSQEMGLRKGRHHEPEKGKASGPDPQTREVGSDVVTKTSMGTSETSDRNGARRECEDQTRLGEAPGTGLEGRGQSWEMWAKQSLRDCGHLSLATLSRAGPAFSHIRQGGHLRRGSAQRFPLWGMLLRMRTPGHRQGPGELVETFPMNGCLTGLLPRA